eukprot:jgi/Tetstr1/430395/TSEL_020205.t1
MAADPGAMAQYVTWLGNLGTIKASNLQPYMSAVNNFFKDHGWEPMLALGDLVGRVRKGLAASQVMLHPEPMRGPLPARVVLKAMTLAKALWLELGLTWGTDPGTVVRVELFRASLAVVYIIQYIRQPRRIAGGGSVARGIAGQRHCARRHPAKAEPARAFCPAGSHVRQGGEPVVESRVRDGRGRLHGNGPARRGIAPAAAWTVANALSVAGVAGGAAWAPRINAAASGPPLRRAIETAVPIDFQEALAEALQRCVNERVVAAVEADYPVVLDRALKWKYMLPQLLLRAPSQGGRRRQHALAWRFRVFAERRMTELVRSWDDARTEVFYAGHARQRRTDADLFAELLVGTADTVVALLRDKHPSRSRPILDTAYDSPVDEAALTVDMPVPFQQLKRHVAAGPSGMGNEYPPCFMGEYAPASGPAAVRAMSEVASMYLQGRLPGWYNRLFASTRLVAPVKKLGESGGSDVRHVAVGEAERRAAERAVVDNMKKAYVSVLAPSQLGVAISAGDSMLIHGVRLIAKKLGPRAVIVHTDLRNAYNEGWRRAIIQRHIDCSPLHPVIPALLASLSTESYLVVDDLSAPLRSEDGVQQGAPLATTFFCVAIHPEVQQCDSTSQVTDGAARFNADD